MDYIGKRFGRLLVEEELPRRKSVRWFLCICDCGNRKEIRKDHLDDGHAKSCRCLQRERTREAGTIHGGSRTRLYRIWRNMMARCYNPKNTSFLYYGAKGIQIAEVWHKFGPFRDWSLAHGYEDKLTIDRIDPEGGYGPNNSQWVTQRENTIRAHLGKKHIRRNGVLYG